MRHNGSNRLQFPVLSKRKQWLVVILTSVLGNLFMVLRTSQIYLVSMYGSTDDETNTMKGMIGHDFRVHHPHPPSRTSPGKGFEGIENSANSRTVAGQQQQKQQQQQHKSKSDSLSFCLLIKDDNAILNEWIAYHFHAFRLRHLIVAVDPSSVTSPVPLLEVWREQFGLDYELWMDDRYMPEYFLKGRYDLVPRMIKFEDRNATKWQEDEEQQSRRSDPDLNEHLRQDYTRINNHRYRQAKFLQSCSRTIQDRNRTWVAHIDTDEYIAINPVLIYRQRQQRELVQQKIPNAPLTARSIQIGGSDIPLLVPVPLDWTGSGASMVWKFLQDMLKVGRVTINWPCISMPRILYGSMEDENRNYQRKPTTSLLSSLSSSSISSSAFNATKFETLRWKYHADFADAQFNKQPKVIMDVSGFPTFNVSRRAFSIHRPSMVLCRKQGQTSVYRSDRFPLVVHHYLGSWERYKSRDDPRRTKTSYRRIVQAIQNRTSPAEDEHWIDGWLASFVETYGINKVRRVLGDHYG
jgi:hypothetical protein